MLKSVLGHSDEVASTYLRLNGSKRGVWLVGELIIDIYGAETSVTGRSCPGSSSLSPRVSIQDWIPAAIEPPPSLFRRKGSIRWS